MKYIFDKIRAKRKKGFTLLEHLVVVLILAVLTAIAIPTYNKAMRRSRVADGLNMLDVLASAQNKYFIQNGSYANNLNDLNTPIKSSHYANGNSIITTNFTYAKDEDNSCIFATSRQGTEYTLAKNYKTNSKIKCHGNGCNSISRYVIPVNNENSLCSEDDSPGCELTKEHCDSLGLMLDFANCECVEDNSPIPVPVSYCDESDAPIVMDLGTSCGAVSCGHNYITQFCKGGQWVTDETLNRCDNAWLTAQCSPDAPNWESCNCKSGIPVVNCEYKGNVYQVGQSYFTKYDEDDTSCKSLSQDRTKCYITHFLNKCSNDGTWEEDYECEDKGTYCSNKGLVLGAGCACEEKQNDVFCEYNNQKYQVDEFYYTTYGEDTDSSCSGGFSGTKTKCYIRHYLKKCTNSGNWRDDYQCEDKTAYCAISGQVLDQSCNCVAPGPQSCDEANKPKCDGTITGAENPCTRGSDPSSGGAQLYTPCQFLCGYNQNVAVCNNETGQWEGSCEQQLRTYNPNIPRTQACQGNGLDGSTCGTQSLEYVECTLKTPYNSLNFNAVGSYGECSLPENDETACWEGKTQACTINGQAGTKTCTGCHWGACVQNAPSCPQNQTPSGSNIAPCHTKNGVTDPELYCGTMTTTQKKCDASTNYTWQWDFSNATCSNVQERTFDYITCTGAQVNCLQKVTNAVCQYSQSGAWGAAYYWNYSAGTSCSIPVSDPQCQYQGQPIGNNVYCSTSCKRITCPSGYTWNSGLKTCVKPQEVNHTGFFYNAQNNSTSSLYNYHSCETYEYTQHDCDIPTCNSGGNANITVLTNKTPEAYCNTNNATANYLVVRQLDSHPGSCSVSGNIYQYKGSASLSGRFFKCVTHSGNVVN